MNTCPAAGEFHLYETCAPGWVRCVNCFTEITVASLTPKWKRVAP